MFKPKYVFWKEENTPLLPKHVLVVQTVCSGPSQWCGSQICNRTGKYYRLDNVWTIELGSVGMDWYPDSNSPSRIPFICSKQHLTCMQLYIVIRWNILMTDRYALLYPLSNVIWSPQMYSNAVQLTWSSWHKWNVIRWYK